MTDGITYEHSRLNIIDTISSYVTHDMELFHLSVYSLRYPRVYDLGLVTTTHVIIIGR